MQSRAEIVQFLNRAIHNAPALNELGWRSFESLIAYLLEILGYQIVNATLATRDGGRDIVATFRTPVSEITTIVECKKYAADRPVGIDVVRQLFGYLEHSRVSQGLLVTTSRFTRDAQEFVTRGAQYRIQLIDRERLLAWIVEARRREEQLANNLAYGINKLPLREVARLEQPDLSNPQELVLPDEFRKRIVAVNNIPIQLLAAIANDPRHLHSLSPREFEEFIAELVDGIGFQDVVLTPRSYDGGKDVIASRLVDGIPVTFYFECKKYAEDNKIQLDTLRALLGTVAHDATKANVGVLVTTSTFTKGCKDLIMSECRLDGKDYDGLTAWIKKYAKQYGFGV